MMKWIHYIGDDRVKHAIYKNLKGPVIVNSVMTNMNRNKAAGKVGIVTKMLSILNDFEIGEFIEIMHKIYDNGEIPEYFNKSIFITIKNKPFSNKCEFHRTTSSFGF